MCSNTYIHNITKNDENLIKRINFKKCMFFSSSALSSSRILSFSLAPPCLFLSFSLAPVSVLSFVLIRILFSPTHNTNDVFTRSLISICLLLSPTQNANDISRALSHLYFPFPQSPCPSDMEYVLRIPLPLCFF